MTTVETLEQLRKILETARGAVQNMDTTALPSRGYHGKYSDFITDYLLNEIETIDDMVDELLEEEEARQ